ncbi:MAG TPA: hypothetical protein VFL66_04330 [Gaiellaceae bacterium]|nr:hypothetical protein [Gaiellaceae bacterium]
MGLHANRKGVALGLVVGLLGGAAGGALATSGGMTTTTTTTTAQPPARQALVQAFLSDLAGRLGVSESTLKEAIQGAAIDQVNQAVKDGKLSQDQANRLIQRIQSGKLGPGFRLGPGFPGRLVHPGPALLGDVLGAAAGYLGMTEAQLRAQLASGKSLSEIAGAVAGKTVAGLEDAIVSAATAALNADTHLSADQEAKLIAGLKSRIDELVTRARGMHGPPPRVAWH